MPCCALTRCQTHCECCVSLDLVWGIDNGTALLMSVALPLCFEAWSYCLSSCRCVPIGFNSSNGFTALQRRLVGIVISVMLCQLESLPSHAFRLILTTGDWRWRICLQPPRDTVRQSRTPTAALSISKPRSAEAEQIQQLADSSSFQSTASNM